MKAKGSKNDPEDRLEYVVSLAKKASPSSTPALPNPEFSYLIIHSYSVSKLVSLQSSTRISI